MIEIIHANCYEDLKALELANISFQCGCGERHDTDEAEVVLIGGQQWLLQCIVLELLRTQIFLEKKVVLLEQQIYNINSQTGVGVSDEGLCSADPCFGESS